MLFKEGSQRVNATKTLKASRENNFELLRLMLASMVMLNHLAELVPIPQLGPLTHFISSDDAVKAFFVISGFLITLSFFRSDSLSDYFKKRSLRIFPAYILVVVLCFLLGMVFSSHSISEYLIQGGLRYLFWNLSFLNFMAPTLPGVFETNSVHAVNGALWTIKIELVFYLSLPLILWASERFGRLKILGFLFISSILYIYAARWYAPPNYSAELARQLPGQLRFFILGIGFAYLQNHFLKNKHLWGGLSLGLFVLSKFIDFGSLKLWLYPFVIATLTIYIAIGIKQIFSFKKFGDISYGAYLFHFPIIQTLVAVGLFHFNVVAGVLCTAIGVYTAAFCSWHYLEKPALKLKWKS